LQLDGHNRQHVRRSTNFDHSCTFYVFQLKISDLAHSDRRCRCRYFDFCRARSHTQDSNSANGQCWVFELVLDYRDCGEFSPKRIWRPSCILVEWGENLTRTGQPVQVRLAFLDAAILALRSYSKISSSSQDESGRCSLSKAV
jgi:hypothetical protein